MCLLVILKVTLNLNLLTVVHDYLNLIRVCVYRSIMYKLYFLPYIPVRLLL